jgi:hypothetical protein
MESVIADAAEMLDKLRQTFYSRRSPTVVKIYETEVQGLFTLFLQHLMSIAASTLIAVDARSYHLEGEIFVKEGDDVVVKKVSGYSDVFVFPSEGVDEVDDLVFLVELEKSFGKLMLARPRKEKEQMLMQLELVGQMTEDKNKTLWGVLGDIFVFSFALRLNPSEAVDHPVFYITDRKSEASSCVLHLLLQMCRLDLENIDTLIRNSVTSVLPETEDDVMPPSHEHNDIVQAPAELFPGLLRSANAPMATRSSTKTNKTIQGTGRRKQSEGEQEDWEERVMELQQWDYRRRGLEYMTADVLRSRANLAAGNALSPLQQFLVDF